MRQAARSGIDAGHSASLEDRFYGSTTKANHRFTGEKTCDNAVL